MKIYNKNDKTFMFTFDCSHYHSIIYISFFILDICTNFYRNKTEKRVCSDRKRLKIYKKSKYLKLAIFGHRRQEFNCFNS